MKKSCIVLCLFIIMLLPAACGKKNPAGPVPATATTIIYSATITPTFTLTKICSPTMSYTITPTPVAHLVISQIYANGGLDAAGYTHDYVELYNPTGAAVPMNNYTLQWCDWNGTAWSVLATFSGTMPAGARFLIKLGSGGALGNTLPPADATGSADIPGDNGKIALIADSSTLPPGQCPSGNILDFVGYGSAYCAEGAPAVYGMQKAALVRLGNGSIDTNYNLTDFTVDSPNPVNLASIYTPTPTVTTTNSPVVSATPTFSASPTGTPGTHLIISQVYAKGGLDWTGLEKDFVEIYNPTYYPVMVSNYTLQFCQGYGVTWQIAANLNGTIQPGSYYLVRLGGDGIGGSGLPYPDAVSDFNMNNFRGKVALVAGTSAMPAGDCPSGPYQDLVAYSDANCFEGGGAAFLPGFESSMIRLNDGTQDTDDNANDFTTAFPPVPRNSGNPATFTYTATATNTPYQSPTVTMTVTASPSITQTFTMTPTYTATIPYLVISQVFRDGGNPAGYDCDFVEIHNPFGAHVLMNNYTLQYATGAGSSWTIIATMYADIGPGEYYLVKLNENMGMGSPLPVAPDYTGSFDLPPGAGKLALVAGSSQLPPGTCPAQKMDFVGYEGANCWEGFDSAMYTDDFHYALVRLNNGNQDTDNNMDDFTMDIPNPRHQGYTPTNTPTFTITQTATMFISPTITMTKTITNTFTITMTPTLVNHLVISQVYKSGPGGTYDHDYVEIHNPTDSDVVMSNYALHMAQGPSGDYDMITLNGTVPGHGYFLIECGTAMPGSLLPAPDAVTAVQVPYLGSGRIAITSDNTPIAGGIKCPGALTLDILGFGYGAACYETEAAGDYGGDITALLRYNNGDTDSDNNAADFYEGPPNPRNANWGTTPVGTATITATSTERPTDTPTPWVVISQVYGGGGQAGALYTNDFVELFNKSAYLVDLTGWSLQYASAAGFGWATAKTNLSGTISPYAYYLVQLSSMGVFGAPLPAPDATGSINMSATAGKVALVRNSTGLPALNCPVPNVDIADLVGYGATADCHEGVGNAPAPSNTTADFRASGGCQDTDANNFDFSTAAPAPKNSQTPHIGCP